MRKTQTEWQRFTYLSDHIFITFKMTTFETIFLVQ